MPRVITESASSPCFMNKPDPKSAGTPEPAAPPRKVGALCIRLFVVVVILLVTAAVVAVAIPWGRYRNDHIVLSEATVKGTVAKIGVRKKAAGELEAVRSNLEKAEKQYKRFSELFAASAASAIEMEKITGDRE